MHSYLEVLFTLLWSQPLQFVQCDPLQFGKLQRQDLTSSPFAQSFIFSHSMAKETSALSSPNLHPLSRAENFPFLCPSLFRENCTYPHLQPSAQQLNGALLLKFPSTFTPPQQQPVLLSCLSCNHPAHESSYYSLVSEVILSFMPLNARKDVQPPQSSMVLQGKPSFCHGEDEEDKNRGHDRCQPGRSDHSSHC